MGKVLLDAVQAVPDRCFDKNPEQRRNSLINKVESFQNTLNNPNAIVGAINKLKNDVRKAVEKDLVDGCQTDGVLESSKEDVLAIIDDTLNRLSLR